MKKKKGIIIACLLSVFILGFIVLFVVSGPDIKREWKLDLAVPTKLNGDVKGGVGGKVAIATNERNNPSSYILKDVDIVLEAKGGELTVTDNTNNIVYTGTYKKYNTPSPDDYDYDVVIDGMAARAYVYIGPKLHISIDDYRMYFIPTNVTFLDRFNEAVNEFFSNYAAIIGLCILELMIIGTVLLMTRGDIKEKFQYEEKDFENVVKGWALKPFIFNVATFIILIGSGLSSIILEWGALLGFLVAFWMGVATALVGPVVCVKSFIYSIAFTKRLGDKDRGIKYIVISAFSSLLTIVILLIMTGLLVEYVH